MAQFARSLLVLQNESDLADFVDGMDLDEQRGEDNIDFDDLQVKGADFTRSRNLEFRARDLGQYSSDVDYRSQWNETVRTKGKRIEPMKQGGTRLSGAESRKILIQGSGIDLFEQEFEVNYYSTWVPRSPWSFHAPRCPPTGSNNYIYAICIPIRIGGSR